MCDYQTLVNTLHAFQALAKQRPVTVGELVDSLDESAYAFIAIILVLPFIQPIPLGPFTVVGGMAFVVLGLQLLRGHESPVLPARLRAVELHEKTLGLMIGIGLRIISWCRKFTKPRLQHWVTGSTGQRLSGSILLAAGLLMAIPFPIPLPLNNALPGLAILFYGIGELEDDGLMLFFSLMWLLLTVLYFTAYVLVLWMFGQQALDYFI